MKTPVITLWQPWASWIMWGWKTIETRTHARFAGLAGRRIGIHAGLQWDAMAFGAAAKWLTADKIAWTKEVARKHRGVLLGTARVSDHRLLRGTDSVGAMIDCNRTERHGLILINPVGITPIPMKGGRGIWYTDVPREFL